MTGTERQQPKTNRAKTRKKNVHGGKVGREKFEVSTVFFFAVAATQRPRTKVRETLHSATTRMVTRAGGPPRGLPSYTALTPN